MIQFKYNDTMKRYDVKLPYTLADEKSMMTVAYISEDNKLTMHRELSLILVKQIVLKWDEYSHQLSREFDDLMNDTECKHSMNPETCISCEEEKGDK